MSLIKEQMTLLSLYMNLQNAVVVWISLMNSLQNDIYEVFLEHQISILE